MQPSRLSRTKSRYSVGRPGAIDVKDEEPEDTSKISNGPNIYNIGNRIGKGAFGEVFQAFNVRTGDLVAVKRFPLNSIDQESLSSIEGEVELMQRLNHPNIVKYIDTIRTRSFLYIVLEYMENGSLANVIDKFGSLTESLSAMYVTQILKGLKYLHEQGVLHRDIKGANILTTKDGLVKLADFGVAIKLSDAGVDEQDLAGTPYWIAPEIIEMSTPTPACDIWSVGCIIIELLTGKPPYFDLQPAAAIFKIVTDEYPPFPEGISQALRDFLFNCFRKEPIMRSSAAKLLEHPWLHNSSTNSNLERHSTMLLGNSRSLASREGANVNEADGMLNAIRMFQREVSPNLAHSTPSDEKNPLNTSEGIAMREIKVDQTSNSLELSHDDGTGKKRDGKSELAPADTNLLSPTLRDLATPKFERETSSTRNTQGVAAISKGNEEAKDIPVENLVNRGLHRNTSDNTLIKRILSSDITGPPIPHSLSISTPERDCKTPELNNPHYIGKISISSGSREPLVANKKVMTPKSSFKSMKAISEDSVDSWDAEIVADLKSISGDSTVGESQAIIRQIDLAAVKKGFISSASFQRNDSIGRRIPSATNVLRTKSTVSMSNMLHKNSGILSPHQSTYLLQKYQEKAEEENYDDLLEASNYIEHDHRLDSNDDPFDNIDTLSSADTQDRSQGPERAIQTHVPMQTKSSMRKQSQPTLESLQTMSSEDYDDLFEDVDNGLGGVDAPPPNFAKKLKQKLTNWSKELADDEMDSFINNQFEEKDFQQDEQKDIHFRRSKDIVELLNKIRPTVTNEEILDFTNQILNVFDKYPEQRDHVITNHGVMPIMDMFEAKAFRSSHSLRFEIYGYNVLKIVNKIVEGSVRAQEQLSLVGIIPSIINFFERSCRPASPRKSLSMLSPNKSVFITSPSIYQHLRDGDDSSNASPQSMKNNVGSSKQNSNNLDNGDLDPLAMEAARFIHTISISSSLTLQMLISAGGLSVLTTMASFGCKITSGSNTNASSSHRRLHSWEELIKREEIRRSEEVEEVIDVNHPDLLSVHVTDRIYDSDSKRYIEIFQLGMDCISRVFAAQKSRTRDFCRLFVKFGLLTHLAAAFENLMTIYKSFLQKSQQFQQHQHSLQSESNAMIGGSHSAFKLKTHEVEESNGLSHKRSGSGNISRSDSSASMETGNLDNCSEALYAQAIAAVFFKFSRSDAIVAETMANSEKGVISVILSTLQAPELKNVDASSTLNSLLASSPGSSMILPSSNASGSVTLGHRRTRSGPQPAYVEIVELLLKCLKNLSMEPSAIEYLEKAATIETLVPLLNGPISDKCKVHILPCIFNMCRIHRKRSDLAAASGIVPHLKKVITEGSHLRQFALPIMFDLANGSSATRDVLWKNECVEFYLDLLKENYWATFALNSLAIWLSNEVGEKDAKVSNVAKMLIQPPCLLKLIEFFRSASKQTVESLHKPLLDMMSKSKELSCALGMSGVFVTSLVKRLLNTNEAIVLRSLLKMLQLIHQNHPCPRQLVLDNNLYKLVKEFAQSETKVVVQQIANRLLADFQVSTLT